MSVLVLPLKPNFIAASDILSQRLRFFLQRLRFKPSFWNFNAASEIFCSVWGMYCRKKTAPPKNAPLSLHHRDQGEMYEREPERALSGSLRLSLALRICLQSPCLAHKGLARLVASLLRYSTLISPGIDAPEFKLKKVSTFVRTIGFWLIRFPLLLILLLLFKFIAGCLSVFQVIKVIQVRAD